MFAIRARRKTVTEKDFLDAVNKVPPALCPAVKTCGVYSVHDCIHLLTLQCSCPSADMGQSGSCSSVHHQS